MGAEVLPQDIWISLADDYLSEHDVRHLSLLSRRLRLPMLRILFRSISFSTPAGRGHSSGLQYLSLLRNMRARIDGIRSCSFLLSCVREIYLLHWIRLRTNLVNLPPDLSNGILGQLASIYGDLVRLVHETPLLTKIGLHECEYHSPFRLGSISTLVKDNPFRLPAVWDTWHELVFSVANATLEQRKAFFGVPRVILDRALESAVSPLQTVRKYFRELLNTTPLPIVTAQLEHDMLAEIPSISRAVLTHLTVSNVPGSYRGQTYFANELRELLLLFPSITFLKIPSGVSEEGFETKPQSLLHLREVVAPLAWLTRVVPGKPVQTISISDGARTKVPFMNALASFRASTANIRILRIFYSVGWLEQDFTPLAEALPHLQVLSLPTTKLRSDTRQDILEHYLSLLQLLQELRLFHTWVYAPWRDTFIQEKALFVKTNRGHPTLATVIVKANQDALFEWWPGQGWKIHEDGQASVRIQIPSRESHSKAPWIERLGRLVTPFHRVQNPPSE